MLKHGQDTVAKVNKNVIVTSHPSGTGPFSAPWTLPSRPRASTAARSMALGRPGSALKFPRGRGVTMPHLVSSPSL